MYNNNDYFWMDRNGYFNSSHLSKNSDSLQTTTCDSYKPGTRGQSLLRNDQYVRQVSNFALPSLMDSGSHYVMPHQQGTQTSSQSWNTYMHQTADTFGSSCPSNSHWRNTVHNSNVEIQNSHPNHRNYISEDESTYHHNISQLPSEYYNYQHFNNNNSKRSQNFQSIDCRTPKIRVKDVNSLNNSFLERERDVGDQLHEIYRREENNCSLDYLLKYPNSKTRESFMLQREYENDISAAAKNYNDVRSDQDNLLDTRIQPLMNIAVEQPAINNSSRDFENHKRNKSCSKSQIMSYKKNFNHVKQAYRRSIDVRNMGSKEINQNSSSTGNLPQNTLSSQKDFENEPITLASILQSNYVALHENSNKKNTALNQNKVINTTASQFDQVSPSCNLPENTSLTNNQSVFNVSLSNTISNRFKEKEDVNLIYSNNNSELIHSTPIERCDISVRSQVSPTTNNLSRQESLDNYQNFSNLNQSSKSISDNTNLKICKIKQLADFPELPKESEPLIGLENLNQLEGTKVDMFVNEELTNGGSGGNDNGNNNDNDNDGDDNVDNVDNDNLPELEDSIEIEEQKPILLQRSQSPARNFKMEKSSNNVQVFTNQGESKESVFNLNEENEIKTKRKNEDKSEKDMKTKSMLKNCVNYVQENKIDALEDSVASHNDNENDSFKEVPQKSHVPDKYVNKINRKKLGLLIEFLESDGKLTQGKGDSKYFDSKSGSAKRKREDDDVLNYRRRKLSKKSIVRNKNKTREMVSLVSHKTPTTKSVKSTANIDPQYENTLKENAVQEVKKNEKKFEVSDASKSEDNEGSILKEENKRNNKTSEGKKCKNSSPKRNLAKENVESKIKKKKVDSTNSSLKKGIELTKSQIKKEVDLKNSLCKKEISKKSVISSLEHINPSSEEYSIINTMRAFQKLQYHYCMGCDLNSSNDSFWINVISGELRCLNCFKKTAIRTKKGNLKTESTPDKIKHHKSNSVQHMKRKGKEKHISFSCSNSKKEELFKEEECVLKSLEDSEKAGKNGSLDKEKKNIEVKPKKFSLETKTIIKEKNTDKEEIKKIHLEIKEEENCVKLSKNQQSIKKNCPSPNPQKNNVKSENRSFGSAQKKTKKSNTEKDVHFKKSNEKYKKQKEECSSKEKAKDNIKKSKEKMKHPGDSIKSKNKVSESKKEAIAARKVVERKKESKVTKSNMNRGEVDSMHLLAQLYEKTKKLSWSLLGET